MTDKKQIMIDGVDVSGCEYVCNTAFGQNGCKSPNCSFKQLARKTQECEELKAYTQRQENQREEYYIEYLKKDRALNEIEEYCKEQNLKYDTTACIILDIINKAKGEDNANI